MDLQSDYWGAKTDLKGFTGTPLTTLGSKMKVSLRIMGHVATKDLRYKYYLSLTLKIQQMFAEYLRKKRIFKGRRTIVKIFS
jgi:hypothetical protein